MALTSNSKNKRNFVSTRERAKRDMEARRARLEAQQLEAQQLEAQQLEAQQNAAPSPIEEAARRVLSGEAADLNEALASAPAPAADLTAASSPTVALGEAPLPGVRESLVQNARWIAIDDIHPMGEHRINPGDGQTRIRKQPRTVFNEEKARELAKSIGEHGQLQLVVVRPSTRGGYELIAGERRWRASKAAGKTHVAAIIRDVNDRQAFRLALVENVQREDIVISDMGVSLDLLRQDLEDELKIWTTKWEIAIEDRGDVSIDLLQRLVGEEMPAWVENVMRRAELHNKPPQVTWDDVGDYVGLEPRSIHYKRKVAGLPREIIEKIEDGKLSGRQARALTLLDTPAQQLQLAKQIETEKLSGDEAAERARGMMGRASTSGITTNKKKTKNQPPAELTPREAMRQAVSLLAKAARGLESGPPVADADQPEMKEMARLGYHWLGIVEKHL